MNPPHDPEGGVVNIKAFGNGVFHDTICLLAWIAAYAIITSTLMALHTNLILLVPTILAECALVALGVLVWIVSFFVRFHGMIVDDRSVIAEAKRCLKDHERQSRMDIEFEAWNIRRGKVVVEEAEQYLRELQSES